MKLVETCNFPIGRCITGPTDKPHLDWTGMYAPSVGKDADISDAASIGTNFEQLVPYYLCFLNLSLNTDFDSHIFTLPKRSLT